MTTNTTSGSDGDLVVAAAMRLEVAALRRGASKLRVVRTGVGPARSQRATSRLLADDARAVAVAGVCGALDPELEPGDVVVANRLLIDGESSVELETRVLVDALEAVGVTPRVGPIMGTDHVVRGSEREALRQSGALAVDMESAWLAAGAGGRPLGVVRVVLDGHRHELIHPATLRNTFIALRKLSATAPALLQWAAACSVSPTLHSPDAAKVD